MIINGGYGVASTNGDLLDSCLPDTSYVPASIIKIPTALAALKILGPDFRFVTEFFRDHDNNIYIKGFGDPLLISEEVQVIATRLKKKGLLAINNLFIDNSAFELEQQIPGLGVSANAYDAPIGPVSVNFNSVSLKISKNGTISSGEKQTPTISLMKRLGKGHGPGNHRINICTGGCNSQAMMAQYTGELFAAFLEQEGVKVTGDFGIKMVPLGATLLYSHENSARLQDSLRAMLHFSSNYIANLVYLNCGTATFGYPATWDKARRAVEAVLSQAVGIKAVKGFIQFEGSGLSRDNRVTVRSMLAVLQAFRPWAPLLARRRGVLTKSGTLDAVYNYAGYLGNGHGYVILLNQSPNTRSTVLDRLKKKYPFSTGN